MTTHPTPTPKQTIEFSSNTIKVFKPRSFEQRYPDPIAIEIQPAGPLIAFMLHPFEANFTYPLTPRAKISTTDRKLIASVLNAREQARYTKLCKQKGLTAHEHTTI